MSEKPNIYQRINSVMKKVKYVQKDASVQGYKAVTHDQVLSVCRQALVDEGVVVAPYQEYCELIQEKGKDFKMHLYEGIYIINFINIDNPSDFIAVRLNAHAQDNGDKAPGKALSYAVKYAILKVLCLETGDSDESRAEATATLTETQIKGVRSLIDGDDLLLDRMLASLGVDSIEDIQKSEYNKVISKLKATKKHANN